MRNDDSGMTLENTPTPASVAPARAAQQPFTSGVAVQVTKAVQPSLSAVLGSTHTVSDLTAANTRLLGDKPYPTPGTRAALG